MDFQLRRRLLDEIVKGSRDRKQLARELLKSPEDGRIKLYVSQRMLCLRRERPSLFIGGNYLPLRGNPHVAAFVRASDGATLIVAAPVLIATLTRGNMVAPVGEDVWRNDVLGVPSGTYEDLFTGQRHTPEAGRLRLSEVFGAFPVAALLAES